MIMQGLTLMALAVMLNVCAQICMKFAALSPSWHNGRGLSWLAASAGCYVGSFALTVLVLRRLPLSSVGPVMAGMTFVLVAMAGWLLFKEDMPIGKIMGIAIIFLGVVAVLWKTA